MAYDEALADRVRTALARRKGTIEKRMFGGLCFMWRGHMVVGIVKDQLMVRVGKDKYDALLAKDHTRPMDFTGRPLRGMLYVDPEGLMKDEELKLWVRRGCDYVKTLPPK
ncbi:MAG: TfoX/Sxy family protein [Deltaproteobacteria bacterium]|nr:TfoX/Sxy family protein [Deltaproteobacteria bacterium]